MTGPVLDEGWCVACENVQRVTWLGGLGPFCETCIREGLLVLAPDIEGKTLMEVFSDDEEAET